ncbi:hypothetical protein FKW77_002507 [Venturia effusa]|uniref:Uncharacterized protein n=1 Tax=Venturia effusa TaxID=50376 RepID=A0A517LGQ8_9PEZI|nr:hypothetical protein FKW77_002507 [Venturia effusa]
MHRQPGPMAVEVVDLTDEIKDEETLTSHPSDHIEEAHQGRRQAKPRSIRQDHSTGAPWTRNSALRPSTAFNRNKDYFSRHDDHDWEPGPDFVEANNGIEHQDRNNNAMQYDPPVEKRRENVVQQPRQPRLHDQRHDQQPKTHGASFAESYSAGPGKDYVGSRQFESMGTRHPHDFPPRGRKLTIDALRPEDPRNGQSGNRNVKQWLKTSVLPPSSQYHDDDQQRASQLNFGGTDDSIVVNVPDSQETSTVDDHDRLLDISEGQKNSTSTLNTSFTAPPLLDQRAHQMKLDLKDRFARIRLQNTLAAKVPSSHPPATPSAYSQQVAQPATGSRVRYRDEHPDGISAATPAKRQKVFDPFEPPPGMQKVGASQHAQIASASVTNNSYVKNRLRIPPEISLLSEAELRKAQEEEEQRTAARIASEREKLLEEDEDLQRIRREERQAQLRIELDEAKAARIEEHRKRMEIMEEKQRAIDEKAAQHKAEEEKRKAAQAERERIAKKEEQAALHEAALQRSIQARKEHDALKAKRATTKVALREECKGPPAAQKPTNGLSASMPKPALHGTLPNQQLASISKAPLQGILPIQKPTTDGTTANPRTGPKTPAERRKEVEEAKARAEAQQPLGLREIDLQNLMVKEKAEKQAEILRQREEKRKQKEEEKKVKELLREERRKEKESAKSANQDRPRKRPVKLPKPGTVVQSTTQQQKPEAPKKTFGGFLEDESDSESSPDTESDEDALFCSAAKDTASVKLDSSKHLGNASSKTAPEVPTASVDTAKPVQSVPGRPVHPTTGGKSMNPEMIAAYLESLREMRDSDEGDTDADVESDVEEIIRARETRQRSPITSRDTYHWVYRVERKTWTPRTEEDVTEWTICGKTGYSSLQQANAMADKESTRQRLGLSLQPCNREWSRKLDDHGMVHIYMDCTNNRKTPGYVKIRVVRQLRAYSNGVRPETKFGWIETTAWEIRKTTTTTTTTAITTSSPRVEEADHPGEGGPEQAPQLSETTEEIELLGSEIYTNVDEANRKAADFAVDLAVPRPATKSLDEIVAYQTRKRENLEGLLEICDQLEQDAELGVFEAEFQMGDAETVKIEVVARLLVGPRNI